MPPLVSVVMPVHNSAPTLGASVRSVLAQTHGDVELLITDDASTDGSWDLLPGLAAIGDRAREDLEQAAQRDRSHPASGTGQRRCNRADRGEYVKGCGELAPHRAVGALLEQGQGQTTWCELASPPPANSHGD